MTADDVTMLHTFVHSKRRGVSRTDFCKSLVINDFYFAGVWRGAGPACAGHLPQMRGNSVVGGCPVQKRVCALEAEQVSNEISCCFQP